MIRPATEADTPAVVELAVDSGLFEHEESGGVAALMTDFFARTRAEEHVCLLDVAEGGRAAGVAYYRPREATDRTWELLMIAVRRTGQGQGRGTALLRHVEDDLRRRGQRLLLVETSGVPEFALTRAFYDRCGYTAEARVRDYYAAGDDIILYRKDLGAAADNDTDTGTDVASRPADPGRKRS